MGPPRIATEEERHSKFWARVDKSGDCWLWTGTKTRGGYGMIRWRVGARTDSYRAHRYAYAEVYGAIPEGAEVCHHCDNPACVRPEHLFVGSRTDNVRDMLDKGRESRGENRYNAKLTADDVIAIRSMRERGIELKQIAAVYGVNKTTVFTICKRSTWKHIP